MTRIVLLERLKEFTEETLKELLLPVPPPAYTQCLELDTGLDGENGEEPEQEEPEQTPQYRTARVFLTALPEKVSATGDAPYILHQVLKSRDFQPPEEYPVTEIVIRTVFCVYHEDGQEGGLSLLNVMERLRIALLEKCVIGRQFKLNLAAGLETLVYPDTGPPPNGTQPYYLGEMITTWNIPIIERKMHYDVKGYSNIKQPGAGAGCSRYPGPGAVHGQYGTGKPGE